MKKLLMAAVLVPGPVAAVELLCDGHYFTQAAGKVATQVVIKLDEKTLVAVTQTTGGVASGIMEDRFDHYGGYIQDVGRKRYWLYLNRYTGDANISFDAEGKTKADFAGNCKPTRKAF